MKKIFTIALLSSFALGAVMFTSCGEEAVTIEGDTITIKAAEGIKM